MTHTDITVRLRAEGSELSLEAVSAIEFLRQCLTQAEAALATTTGSLRFPSKEERDEFRVAHDVPPTTPR